MELIVGNRNYSSWSMRAGLVVLAFDLPVETTVLWLDDPDAAAQKRRRSPAGRVPVLHDGDLTVWDSLAICEYLAERFPDKELWPADPGKRARARSLCAEMHSGFPAIRELMPMNLRGQKDPRNWPAEVAAEIERLTGIFATAQGPFLFGRFTIADAFFAPVIGRFETYQIEVPDEAGHYCATLFGHPAVRRWVELAEQETRHLPQYD